MNISFLLLTINVLFSKHACLIITWKALHLLFVYPLFCCISAAFPQVVWTTEAPAFYLSWNQTSSVPILSVTRMFIFTHPICHSQLKILHSHSAVFSECHFFHDIQWGTKVWEHFNFACFDHLTHFNYTLLSVISKQSKLSWISEFLWLYLYLFDLTTN